MGSVAQKCQSEVLLRSVAQKVDFSRIAQKCRSEVSMSNVDQMLRTVDQKRSVDPKCGV